MTRTRLPAAPRRFGLGVGLDLPWGAPIGLGSDPERGEVVAERVARFFARYAGDFGHLFVSWQPRSRSRLDANEYFPVYDDLFARAPRTWVRALHQTAFNLGALEVYDRGPLVEFTNALIDRYDLASVNEDLGLWSIRGKALPYPLPPYLTEAGLAAAIANTAEVQERLAAPLLVEFPGFSDGTSFLIGAMDAYSFFRRVVEETGSPATLDTGHLLSYRWLMGDRGEALFDGLERLPLASCFEIHLSGCAIEDGRFLDHHHGVLLDAQLELFSRLAPLCPNLRAVTYEDPRFDEQGVLLPETTASFERLRDAVARCAA